MILLKWQTRVACWNISTHPKVYWWPDADGDMSTWWNLSWLWFTLERISKRWHEELDECGCDSVSMLEWAASESDPAPQEQPGTGPTGSPGEASRGHGDKS
jgi:hypothetical protein